MKPGDKVQAKKRFYLRNAVVDLVLGDKVQVRHDMRKLTRIGPKPQKKQREVLFRARCKFVDIFSRDKLVEIK